MKQACCSSFRRRQPCSDSGNGHRLPWVLIKAKSHLSWFTSISGSSPHLSHHLPLGSFFQLLPGLASSTEPIKISQNQVPAAEGQAVDADKPQCSLTEMYGHLLIKHKEGQALAVAEAAWGERMLYGLTCPSAPLQAGDCWACFHRSLWSVAFVVGSRAQVDFCTIGMPLASVSMLAHHPVHAMVHLAVGHAVPAGLPCTTCGHMCQKRCACV